MAGSLGAFPAAAFLVSFQLFALELMSVKALLPAFGGGPYVWSLALMFFQGLLFLAYAYGRLVASRSGPWAARLHLGLVAAAAALSWLPAPVLPASGELAGLLLALARRAGLPFFALAACTPILQGWLRRRRQGEDPSFLFATSNAGCFAALFAYPLLLEPLLSLHAQSRLLSAGLAVTVALLLFCLPGRAEPPRALPAAGRQGVLLWVLLSLGPTAALLCATNLLSLDLAAVPLVWVLPLAAYLATLVLAFQRRSWLPQRPAFLVVGCGLVILVGTSYGLESLRHAPDAWFAMRKLALVSKCVLILAALFMACLACHRALAQSRPEPSRLPGFYLWMALGGWLGGLLVSVVLPVLGRSIASPNFEALFAALLCAGALWWRDRRSRGLRLGLWAALLTGLACCAAYAAGPARSTLFRLRDFYGFYRVTEAGGSRALFFGRTVHGMQSLDPARSGVPLAYYHPHSPFAEFFAEYGAEARRLGVVGLGTGACAAMGREGQAVDFYELDPDLEAVARKYFTFLGASRARVRVMPGDARVSLARGGEAYDVIVLDAFSGGAIPLHLLTVEALRVYASRLAPDGLILAHVTNRFLDLRPMLAALARELGWSALAKRSDPALVVPGEEFVSSWVALGADRGKLARLERRGWTDISAQASPQPWTDERSSVWSALR